MRSQRWRPGYQPRGASHSHRSSAIVAQPKEAVHFWAESGLGSASVAGRVRRPGFQADRENNSGVGAICSESRAPSSDVDENLSSARASCSGREVPGSGVDENLSNAGAFCSGCRAQDSDYGQNLSNVRAFCSACGEKRPVSVGNAVGGRFHGRVHARCSTTCSPGDTVGSPSGPRAPPPRVGDGAGQESGQVICRRSDAWPSARRVGQGMPAMRALIAYDGMSGRYSSPAARCRNR